MCSHTDSCHLPWFHWVDLRSHTIYRLSHKGSDSHKSLQYTHQYKHMNNQLSNHLMFRIRLQDKLNPNLYKALEHNWNLQDYTIHSRMKNKY